MINYEILLKLLIAHLIGDFVFQTSGWIKKKRENKLKTFHFYIHCILHGLLAYILVYNLNLFWIPLVILITHFAIDVVKIYFFGRNKYWFYIDQILHITVILILWIFGTNQQYAVFRFAGDLLSDEKFWLIIFTYLLVSKPASVVISEFIGRWNDETIFKNTLRDAGKWIGYLERFLIVTFILIGQIQAIGFMLAAKSIFRFGDLKEYRDIKFTEYILIGTLSSFSIAIIAGIIAKKIL